MSLRAACGTIRVAGRLLVLSALTPVGAAADPITVLATLKGNDFLQSGSLTNLASAPIVSVTYSLGAPAPGIATWEAFVESPPGTRSEQLSDGFHYQTIRWAGLQIAPGDVFNFSGLDIDYIVSVSPLVVSGQFLDETGESLRRAFISASLADGTVVIAGLLQQAWRRDQSLTLTAGATPVPEPSTLLLLGLGGLAAASARRRARQTLGRSGGPDVAAYDAIDCASP